KVGNKFISFKADGRECLWIYRNSPAANAELITELFTSGVRVMLLDGIYTSDTLPPYEPFSYYGLYFYIYNPTRLNILKDSASNQITIMSNISKWGDMHQKYQLKLVDTYGEKNESETHTDALILKFALLNYDDFVTNNPMAKRGYDISEFELMHDDNINAKAYAVAQNFIYTKVNGYTTATIDKTETVRIEKENLAFAYYRSPDEGSVDNYHDLQSVFFTIPKEYSEKYGELEKVSAVWEECLSKPILIVNNKDIYNDFQEVLGKEVPDDFLYTFGYDLKFYDVGCYGFFTLKYLYKFDTIFNKNIDLTEKPIPYNDNLHIFYSGSDTYYKNLIDKIYLAYYSKDVFSDEDKEIVTREELESDLDKYLWSDECFESIDKTNFESPVKFDNVKMNNFVYYRNPNFWEKLSGSNNKFNGQLPYTNLDKIDFEYLKSYNKEKFKEKYYVSFTEDYNSIKTLFESIIDKFTKKITADMYCLRFTVTPYITHKVYMFDNEGKHIDCDAMVVQPTAIRNFDFIDLTYNKNGVITIIPVVGSPQNTISGVTPNPNYAEPDPYAKILEFLEKILPVVLVLIVISIILRAYQIFKRPKIIIKEERKRKE
ncbi:MAG: hypothetical protein J6A95_01415, partial [Clostridia bacterium]|nr:hypothetical protein [Clostridia bacterium]